MYRPRGKRHIASEQVTPPLAAVAIQNSTSLPVTSTKALVKSTSLLPSVAGDPHTKSNGRQQDTDSPALAATWHRLLQQPEYHPTNSDAPSTRIAGDRGVVGERGDAGDIAESGRVRNQTV